jgi:ATP-dependent DNA ligase
MTSLVPELADLPPRLTLDGELVAFGQDKLPSFPRLCERMLHGKRDVPVAYLIFDVLSTMASASSTGRTGSSGRCSRS